MLSLPAWPRSGRWQERRYHRRRYGVGGKTVLVEPAFELQHLDHVLECLLVIQRQIYGVLDRRGPALPPPSRPGYGRRESTRWRCERCSCRDRDAQSRRRDSRTSLYYAHLSNLTIGSRPDVLPNLDWGPQASQSGSGQASLRGRTAEISSMSAAGTSSPSWRGGSRPA